MLMACNLQSFCWVTITINSVLSSLTRSMYWISQRLSFSMQHSITGTVSSWDVLLWGLNSDKSAYSPRISACVEADPQPPINSLDAQMMNKRGPRYDPCGTPQSKRKRSERNPLMETCWPLLATATPHIPNFAFRRVGRILWLLWLYQKWRWDQAWPTKSSLECSSSWEYHSWLWFKGRFSAMILTIWWLKLGI